MWQDPVITLIQFALSGALIPAILSPDKPGKITCSLNSTLLYALSFVFYTMGLWLSSFSSLLVAICWTILLLQKRK